MKYMGSKNRLAKELVPIIQSYIDDTTVGYLEPFVGGANIIDKINHHNKIGCDINRYLIALLKKAQSGFKFPDTISEDEYIKVRDNKDNFEDWYVGLVGFCASYNAKFFGGYAGATKTKEGIRHYDREAIRNLTNQVKNIKEIKFLNITFTELPDNKIKGYVIYCDPPYRDTTKYNTEDFPYEYFYDWCRRMAKDNIILISEYNMPDDFECIWEKEHKTSLDKNDNQKIRIEKLFIAR